MWRSLSVSTDFDTESKLASRFVLAGRHARDIALLAAQSVRMTSAGMVRARWRTAAMWAVLLGIPAVCIAMLVDRRSMWLDETTSMLVARRDFAGMADTLRHVDAVFAFYYGLLHVWLSLGTGTVHARMLSVLFAHRHAAGRLRAGVPAGRPASCVPRDADARNIVHVPSVRR